MQEKAAETWEDRVRMALDSLCRQPLFESSQLGLYVYDLTAGQQLYTFNGNQRLRPASCQKVVTGVAALHFLSGDYQFCTHLYHTGSIAGGILRGDVYVVGGMDPLFSRSDLAALANTLRQKGVTQITGNLYADLSMKDDLPYGMGWCWDDKFGPLSALLVDGKDAFAVQWPKALAATGIKTAGRSVQPNPLPRTGAQYVCTASHSIDEVLGPMLKESENIFAECVFYQIAALGGQKQAGQKQAAEHIQSLLDQLGLQETPCMIADGSGLSLYNYTTPQALVAVLNYAYLTPAVRDHFLPALPIAGMDGTLEKRMKGTAAEGNVRAKTGTVSGISSLAGYLHTTNGHELSFCIINQGVVRSAQGRAFQDQVCQRLCSIQ